MNNLRKRFLCIGSGLIVLTACMGLDRGKAADFLFHSGHIYAVIGDAPRADAVAVTDDRISFVGSRSDAESLIGPDTRIIDLDGKMLMPGLIDSHSHIFAGSFSSQRVNLSLADTMDKFSEALLVLLDENPGDGVVYARGWQNHLFPPDGPRKEMLDAVFGDRPVVLGSVDGHSTWFSSKAFEIAGVDADTQDPEAGVSFFERDKTTGEPLGTAREGAGNIVSNEILNFDRLSYKRALERWLPEAAAAGLTTVFDAGASAPTEEDAYQTLAELEQEGKLTLRVFGSVGYQFGDDQPESRLLDLKERFTGAYYRPYAVKLYADGVPEAHTAFLLTPYLDRPGSTGEPMIPADRMAELITSAFEQDVPVHVHAIGDGAIRLTLDAIELARNTTGKHEVGAAIAHMDFVQPADMPRFAELGVVAQTSIQWAAQDPSYENIGAFVGMQRMHDAYPVKSLIEAGALQTFGADWPAAAYFATYRPLDLLEVAVTRQLPGEIEMPVRNRNERLELSDAIAGMTIRAAIQLEADGEIGSIEVGKKADLIVLDRNLFEIPAHEIHDVRILMTLMDGRIVHEADTRLQ
jgi:predicted amidohydrolase YtcJ